MSEMKPRWGSLLYHADYDFIVFGVLLSKCLLTEAFYHSTQAVEKYLKVLALDIYDHDEAESIEEWEKFLKKHGHNLDKLGMYCSSKHSYYKESLVIENLKKFTLFDQSTRYPWVQNEPVNGFCGSDASVFYELVQHLRNDIPIQTDDYPLGLLLRGYHHKTNKPVRETPIYLEHRKAAMELKANFPNVNELIRI